jgi:hypothetical protein
MTTTNEARERANAMQAGAPIDAFLEADDAPVKVIVDRTEMQAWGECPYMASKIADGTIKVWPEIAAAGEESHKAFFAPVLMLVELSGACSPADLRIEMENTALGSRPDVQPQVLQAIRPSIYRWCEFINTMHPGNILGFDGGEKIGRSGQLTMDLGQKYQYTSELDLLYTGPSIDELHECDVKSGHKIWTASDVAESFQFQSHALLVMENWPEIERLIVQVWNARAGYPTGRVIFERRDKDKWKSRVYAALAAKVEAEQQSEVPCWPTVEKCANCLCASQCPAADRFVWTDPKVAVGCLVAAEAKADGLKKLLTRHCDEHGDIVLSDGTAFGRNKPKAERKASASLYQAKEVGDADGA